MPRLIVHGFTISLDGYGAGPAQSLEAPMGTGGQGLHPWLLRTQYFQKTHVSRPPATFRCAQNNEASSSSRVI